MINRRRRNKLSAQQGVTLIECLVALILGSFFCLALLELFAQSLRLSTQSTNSQAAHLIAQTVLDSFKETPYSWIQQNSGNTFNLSQGHTNLFHPLPAWLDFTDFIWSNTLVGFTGTVTLEIQPAADPNSYLGIVTVIWSDNSETNKTYQTMTLVEQTGTNRYVQQSWNSLTVN